MTEVATHYIEDYKIDGWRLDQAYQVPLDTWRHIKRLLRTPVLLLPIKTVTVKRASFRLYGR